MTIKSSARPGPTPAELLEFMPVDLAANRNGQVTPAQQQRLNRERQSHWRLFMTAALLFVAVAVAAFLADLMAAALLFGGVGIMLLGAFLWSLRRQAQELRDLRVESRAGKIVLTRAARRAAGSPRRTYHYTLAVEGVQLSIDKDLYAALEREQGQGQGQGQSDEYYTVYYLPRRKILLSLEPGLVRANGSAEGGALAGAGGSAGAPEIWRAIDILEGRAVVGEAAREAEPGAGQSTEQQLEAARATLVQAGVRAIPHLSRVLHKPVYRQIVADMGLMAVDPLMRLVAADPAVVESPLLNHVVATILAIADDERDAKLLGYFEPQHPPSVRMVALRVLTSRRNPRRVRILQSAATDPESAIAAHAQQTLARIDHLHGYF